MCGGPEKYLFHMRGVTSKEGSWGKNYQYRFPHVMVKINCEISHIEGFVVVVVCLLLIDSSNMHKVPDKCQALF